MSEPVFIVLQIVSYIAVFGAGIMGGFFLRGSPKK